MLKLTLTTDQSGNDVAEKANALSKLLGVDVEVIAIDGYTVATSSADGSTYAKMGKVPTDAPASPIAPEVFATPVFTPVFTPPESAEQTNG